MNGFVIGDRGLGAAGDMHPDWMLAYSNFGPYLVIGASAIGQDHLARASPRDDAFVIRCVGPWLAIGVSDGVGSRPFSRYGASYVADVLTSYLLNGVTSLQLTSGPSSTLSSMQHERRNTVPPNNIEESAVELPKPDPVKGARVNKKSFLEMLSIYFRRSVNTQDASPAELQPAKPQHLQQMGSVSWSLLDPSKPLHPTQNKPDHTELADVVVAAFRKTNVGLRDHARRLQLEPSDLSCTALGLLFNNETGQIVVGQVGDGAVLGLTLQGKLTELVPVGDTGDPQSTYTVNRPDFETYLAVQELPASPANPPIALFLMTDGLSGDLLYSPDEEARIDWAKNVDKNLRYSPSPTQAATGLLNWLAGYQVTGSYDDRTLVVVTLQERESERS